MSVVILWIRWRTTTRKIRQHDLSQAAGAQENTARTGGVGWGAMGITPFIIVDERVANSFAVKYRPPVKTQDQGLAQAPSPLVEEPNPVHSALSAMNEGGLVPQSTMNIPHEQPVPLPIALPTSRTPDDAASHQTDMPHQTQDVSSPPAQSASGHTESGQSNRTLPPRYTGHSLASPIPPVPPLP